MKDLQTVPAFHGPQKELTTLEISISNVPKGICPTCATPLGNGEVYVCSHCKGPSHKECYDWGLNCGTYGCKGAWGMTTPSNQGLSSSESGQTLPVGINLEESLTAIEEAQERVKDYTITPSWASQMKFRFLQLCYGGTKDIHPLLDSIGLAGLFSRRSTTATGAYLAATHATWAPEFPVGMTTEYLVSPSSQDLLTQARIKKSRGAYDQGSGGYTKIVHDLLTAHRPKDAMTIAKESEDPGLIRKPASWLGRYYMSFIDRELTHVCPVASENVIIDIFNQYYSLLPKPAEDIMALFTQNVYKKIVSHNYSIREPDNPSQRPPELYFGVLNNGCRNVSSWEIFESIANHFYKAAQSRLANEGQWRQQLALARAFDDKKTQDHLLGMIQTSTEVLERGENQP